MRAVSGRAARRFSLSPTAVMWMGASAKIWGSSLRTILPPALKHDGKAAVCDGVFEKRRVRGGAQCAERLGEFFFRAHLQKHVDGAVLIFPKLTGKHFSLCGKRGINRGGFRQSRSSG